MGNLLPPHPAPVVPDTQPRQAELLQPDFHTAGSGVKRVLHQLLDGAPDTGHHLAALQEAHGVLGEGGQSAIGGRLCHLSVRSNLHSVAEEAINQTRVIFIRELLSIWYFVRQDKLICLIITFL